MCLTKNEKKMVCEIVLWSLTFRVENVFDKK